MNEFSESPLSSYTLEDLSGGKLPNNISSNRDKESHGHKETERREIISLLTELVRGGENRRLEHTIDQIVHVVGEIRQRTNERFVIVGSMGMYGLFSELRDTGIQLSLLEQRIAQGKNDFDIGVSREPLGRVMDSLGFSPEEKQLQRGRVGDGREMVDVMERRELPHFPYQEVEIKGVRFLVQSPEEMIFEKVGCLINPGVDESGKPLPREIKWGVDIKLLKAYLAIKHSWSDEEVETYLSKRWDEYMEDRRSYWVEKQVERVRNGETVEEVVRSLLQEKLGRTDIGDIKEELNRFFGPQAVPLIEQLLLSSTPDQFESSLRSLIDQRKDGELSYEEALSQAEQEFEKLIQSK